MRTIAHLSDIHFGKTDPAVVEAIVADLCAHKPDVLVVSGDLTQRARSHEYAAAADFLHRLPTPLIVIPGNHDIPKFNLLARFFWPLRNYRRFITTDLFPAYHDDQISVVGLNSARSFTHKSGWLSREQIDRAAAMFADAKPGAFKVLVTHHPFIPPPRRPRADVIRRGKSYLPMLANAGVDLLLAGHLHLAYHDDLRSHYKASRASVLSVQAGTATSTRRRGEPNAYNWISVSPNLCTVGVRSWSHDAFGESLVTRYARSDGVWQAQKQVPVDEVGSQVMTGAMDDET